jgi:hypothetical protein
VTLRSIRKSQSAGTDVSARDAKRFKGGSITPVSGNRGTRIDWSRIRKALPIPQSQLSLDFPIGEDDEDDE